MAYLTLFGFLTKFVSNVTRGESGKEDLDRFLQKPKQRTTLNSFMKRQAKSQFQGPPLEQPENLSPDDICRLLGVAASKSVRTVMKNHYFTIGGKIFSRWVCNRFGYFSGNSQPVHVIIGPHIPLTTQEARNLSGPL